MIFVELTAAGTTHRLSQEGITGDTYYWDNKIINFAAATYTMNTVHGGHVSMGFGGIELSHDFFDNDTWPPRREFDIVVSYSSTTNENDFETIVSGTLCLKSLDRNSVKYDLYNEKHDTKLLSETTDYDGNTVSLPRAFGTISHKNPVKLPEVGSKPTYHGGYLAGTAGSSYSVFDDGVNIDGNVTDLGDGTFNLSATPVGEVTISGTASYTTLSGVIGWCASQLGLSIDVTNAESPSPGVNYWTNSQGILIDSLSGMAAFFCHLYYIKDNTLYLVDLDIDNGSRTITEFDYMPSRYQYNVPVSEIKSGWVERYSGEFVSGGKCIREKDHEVARSSDYPYGQEKTLTPYHTEYTNIETALDDIMTITHKPKTFLVMPLTGNLPIPGEKFTFEDTSLGQDIDTVIRARTIRYDFSNEDISVEGEGSINA